MGDMGELFNDLKKQNQVKRWENHAEVLQKLKEAGIEVVELSKGCGVYRPLANSKITIYATKNAWWHSGIRKRYYDIESLIKFIKGE